MSREFSLSGSWQSKIAQSLSDLTTAQRCVADHVLEHPMDLAFMTVQQLATEIGVSEASVVRFARAVGYQGYPALQQDVRHLIGHAFSPMQRLEQAGLAQGAPLLDGLSRAIRGDIESLIEADECVSRQDFFRAVHLLDTAETIHIVGTRGLAAPAHLAYHFLSQIRPGVRLVSAHLDRFADDLNRLSPASVMLAFDFGRYNRRTLTAVQFARRRGSAIAVIADSSEAPTVRFADATLVISPVTLGFFQSHTAAVSVVSALVAEVAMMDRTRTIENLQLLEDALTEFEVFVDSAELTDESLSERRGGKLVPSADG